MNQEIYSPPSAPPPPTISSRQVPGGGEAGGQRSSNWSNKKKSSVSQNRPPDPPNIALKSNGVLEETGNRKEIQRPSTTGGSKTKKSKALSGIVTGSVSGGIDYNLPPQVIPPNRSNMIMVPVSSVPVKKPFRLPDMVLSCVCKLSLYFDDLECGVVELQGRDGEKAYCLFLSKVFVSRTITSLANQFRIGQTMRVNARLINQEYRIPYLASMVISEGVDDQILDNFRDPTPEDVDLYGQLAPMICTQLEPTETVVTGGGDDVIEILDDVPSVPHTLYNKRLPKLPQPTPAPATPMLHPGYSVPPPTTVQYPPAVLYPVPPSRLNGSRNHSNLKSLTQGPPSVQMPPLPPPSQVTSQPPPPLGQLPVTPLAEEFVEARQQAVTNSNLSQEKQQEEQLMLAKEYRKQLEQKGGRVTQSMVEFARTLKKGADGEKKRPQISLADRLIQAQEEETARKLRKAQEDALQKMKEMQRSRWTKSPEKPVTEALLGNADIDQAIAKLDADIRKKSNSQPIEVVARVPPASNVIVDKYGYVMRKDALPDTSVPPPSSVPKDPMDYYKSMFGGDNQERPPASTTKRRTRSPSPVRRRRRSKSGSPSSKRRRRSKTRRRKSKSRERRSRRSSRSSRKSRSKSLEKRSREKRKSPERRKSTERRKSPERRKSTERRKSPEKSPLSRARAQRSRSNSSRDKSRSRSTSRRALRQSRSRSRSKLGGKLRMDSESKKKSSSYSGPPVPAFMLHPADRLCSGGGSSVRKRMMQRKEKGVDEVDECMAALDETLALIQEMKADKNEDLAEFCLICMEVEVLDDGTYRQFTQIGVSAEDEETGVFNKTQLKSILPTYMNEYDKNLILKNQNNLHSSLKFKYDEDTKEYTFNHVKKGEEKLVSEEHALEGLISFIKLVKNDRKVVIFTHSKGTIVPLMLARLIHYNKYEEFSEVVEGFSDFNSCIVNLKFNGFWKESKFQDLTDIYKHIMGKQWPREQRHSDGISTLSGSVLKKLISNFTEYLEDEQESKFSMLKFLKVSGLRSVEELRKSLKKEIQDTECNANLDRNDINELELKPSDRPGEITIVTLKRFECIEVPDIDEVDEEGINEDDYFDKDGVTALVATQTVIKPGFVVSVNMKIKSTHSNPTKSPGWTLVAKNMLFGVAKLEEEGEYKENKKRMDNVKKCEIPRQIVEIHKSLKPNKDDLSTCEGLNVIQVKVLNPLDVDITIEVGDQIAVAKHEKPKDPSDPERKTYSQIKLEAEQVQLLEQERYEREVLAKEQQLEKEKEKKRTRKRKRGKKTSERAAAVRKEKANSNDMDTLDYEPVESDENYDEENISSDEDEEIFSSTISAPESDKRSSCDKTTQGSNIEVIQKERNPQPKKKQRKRAREALEKVRKSADEQLNRGEEQKNDSENHTVGHVAPVIGLNNHSFYVETAVVYTEIKAGETQDIPMVIVPAHGFSAQDMLGRKCRVYTNQKFVDREALAPNKYAPKKRFNNYRIPTTELTPNSMKNGMVELTVPVENITAVTNYYVKGVSLAKCRFIEESEAEAEESVQLNPIDFYTHHFRCQLVENFEVVDAVSVKTVMFQVEEQHGFTAKDMVGHYCRIKKDMENADVYVGASFDILDDRPVKVFGFSPPNVDGPLVARVSVELENESTKEQTYMKKTLSVVCMFQASAVSHATRDRATEQVSRVLPAPLSMMPTPVSMLPTQVSMLPTPVSMLPDPVHVSRKELLVSEEEPPPPGEETIQPIAKTSQVEEDVQASLVVDDVQAATLSRAPVRYEQSFPSPVASHKKTWEEGKGDTNTLSPENSLPTEEELKVWSVKKLKNCLGEAGLHQYGLKLDLVKRLLEYYQKNPSKVPGAEVATKSVPGVKSFVQEVIPTVDQADVLNTSSQSSSSVTMFDLPIPVPGVIGKKISVLEKNWDESGNSLVVGDADGNYYMNGKQLEVLNVDAAGNKLVVGSDGNYYRNGKKLEVLKGAQNGSSKSADGGKGDQNGQSHDHVGSDGDSNGDHHKESNVEHEKILKKFAEIKAYEKEGIEFYKTGMSIKCTESFRLEPMEKKIMTFKMPELDLFVSELAGRRLLVKERDNNKRILTVYRQVTNIIVNERKSEVDILVCNEKDNECIVSGNDKEKLIRVYIEKRQNDPENNFDIPEDEDVVKEVDKFMEKPTYDAATTTDIVLKPKTYHTEVCIVQVDKTFSSDPVVLLERTKASSMKIGMRKMILVPKVMDFMKLEGQQGKVSITMYNASKQTLRISKKTNIASVRVQKPKIAEEKQYKVSVDSRGKKGEILVDDAALVKEDRLVLLTVTKKDVKKPSVVKTLYWNKKAYVPLNGDFLGSKDKDSCRAQFLVEDD